MAHLLRLIVGCVLLWSSAAFALVPLTPASTEYKVAGLPSWWPTAQGACDNATPELQVAYNVTVTSYAYGATAWNPTGGPACAFNFTANVNGNPGSWVLEIESRPKAAACPAHSLPVSSGCQCDTGYIEQGGSCVPKPPECNAGEVFSEGSQRPLGMGENFNDLSAASRAAIGQRLPTCAGNGCALAPEHAYGGNGVYAGRLGNVWTLNVSEVRYTGGRCTPSDKDISLEQEWMNSRENDLAPSTCATGYGPGTVNGTTVCMPYGSVAGSSGTSSSSSGTTTTGGTGGTTGSGDGSGTGATIIGTDGPSNSSDTTITSCNGTTCTTTTTSQGSAQGGTGTGAGGTGTGGTGTGTQECAKAAASGASAPAGGATCTNTTTTTQPQTEFCSKPENKKNVACVNDKGQSRFGGTCAAGFTAQSDDAVVNAMAEETFRQNCKVNPADSETTLAAAERVKTGDQTTTNPNNTSVSISPSSIDTSDALGGGSSCIADKAITVFGGVSVVVPFSKYCEGFSMLGALLVGLSFLVAGAIILRG